MILPLHSRGYVSQRIARGAPYLPAICLITSAVCFIASTAYAVTNHPPTVSWITDQAITNPNIYQFDTVYFRAWDKETVITTSNLTATIENDLGSPNFIPPGSVHIDTCTTNDNGCPQDGTGFKLTFDQLPANDDGAATIVITATDTGNPAKTAASSFTLRKQSAAMNPPTVGGIPQEQIQENSISGYGPVWFVVDDLDANGVDDAIALNGDSSVTYSATSDNPDVVPIENIQFTPPVNGLKWSVTVQPQPDVTGRAVITITFTDCDGFKTSTSFVLDVIDSTNTAPSFTPAPSPSGTFIEHDVTQSQYIVYYFKVTDSETQKGQLLVTATSSNANLVPNDPDNNLVVTPPDSTGIGHITITPVLPLPSPSPGVPQAATITLSVTDDAYTRRKQFLYVAKNPNSAALSFSRPTGVWNLDPGTGQHRADDQFLTGEMRRISWNCIDNGLDPGTWDWSSLNDAFSALPDGQDMSII
jgi:hypothetical protein